MKTIIATLILFSILTSCSKKVNPYLEQNRVITEFNNNFYNDSLLLAATFPGDIALSTDSLTVFRKSLNKAKTNIRRIKPDEVIVSGITELSPHYQLLLAVGENPFIKENGGTNTQTTVVPMQKKLEDWYMVLVGSANNKYLDNMVSDMKGIMNSVTYGNLYEPKQPKNAFTVFSDEMDKDMPGIYSSAFLVLWNRKDNYHNRMSNSTFLQAALTSGSMIMDMPLFDSLEDNYEAPRRMDLERLPAIEDTVGLYDNEVTKRLLGLASDHKVVMMNELHWDKRHRYEVLKLLPAMKELGFNYVAMEAVFPGDSTLNKRGYPIKDSGFYIKEPVMAQIVRKALNLGFKVVGYDHYGSSREKMQAKNLYEKTFGQDSTAKVFVLAGVGHIHESKKGSRYNMAAEFKETYGIDPLTIDQHKLGLSDDIYEERDKILLSASEIKLLDNPGIQTDYYLGTAKPDTFLLQEPPLFPMMIEAVNDSVINETTQLLTQVFFTNELEAEGNQAIPLYNHWGLKEKYFLAPGRYTWRVVNAYGDVLQKEQLVIE